MNEGFKGTRVLLTRLAIEAGPTGLPSLNCAVQFVSDDDTVHAICQHSFLLDEDNTDGLAAAAKELVRLATQKVETIHFNNPNEVEGQVLRGIAETLRSLSRSPDEPGTQG